MPDWKDYDEIRESNTLASTCKFAKDKLNGIQIPNLQRLGLGNIIPIDGLDPSPNPIASFGRMAELNPAKDTITGHWEMMGIKASKPFPYYPKGFPERILEEFKKQTGAEGVLGNCTASGTEIINRFGDEHRQNKYPIIYTSADSVLQIASDIDVIPLEILYQWCQIAREIMRGDDEVARIIARPFKLNPNHNPQSQKASDAKYIRLGDKRHDYSILPHSKSVLELALDSGASVLGLGKIQDIFSGVGVPHNIHTDNNTDGINKLIEELSKPKSKSKEILFINLVETDSNYGHRRDPEGFARALEAIDKRIPGILESLDEDDILMISADHGCDPTAAGTDHTREFVPIICYQKSKSSQDLGTRKTFADIGATIVKHFELDDSEIVIKGESLIA